MEKINKFGHPVKIESADDCGPELELHGPVPRPVAPGKAGKPDAKGHGERACVARP